MTPKDGLSAWRFAKTSIMTYREIENRVARASREATRISKGSALTENSDLKLPSSTLAKHREAVGRGHGGGGEISTTFEGSTISQFWLAALAEQSLLLTNCSWPATSCQPPTDTTEESETTKTSCTINMIWCQQQVSKQSSKQSSKQFASRLFRVQDSISTLLHLAK